MYLVAKRNDQRGPPVKDGYIWEVQCSDVTCGMRFDVNTGGTASVMCPKCGRACLLSEIVITPV